MYKIEDWHEHKPITLYTDVDDHRVAPTALGELVTELQYIKGEIVTLSKCLSRYRVREDQIRNQLASIDDGGGRDV